MCELVHVPIGLQLSSGCEQMIPSQTQLFMCNQIMGLKSNTLYARLNDKTNMCVSPCDVRKQVCQTDLIKQANGINKLWLGARFHLLPLFTASFISQRLNAAFFKSFV